MTKKYYAVRKGKTTGIFESWDECRESVSGYSGAEYKGFLSVDDALAYLDGREKESIDRVRDDAAVAYVDGSYDAKTGLFSFGAVIFFEDKETNMSRAFEDAELSLMRNVAGEIKGAVAAMEYCIQNGIKKLDLYYDYQGIESWCTGAWKTNKTGTVEYKRFYDSIKSELDVRFVKVKGHSGDKYNDKADSLAKSALGL